MKERVRAGFGSAWAAVERPRVAWPVFAVAFCFPPLYARFLIGWDHGTGFGLADLRGAVSDVFISLALVGFCILALRALDGWLPRLLATWVALTWALFSYGGFEHVLANDAAIDVTLLKYLGDETFVRGSSEFERPGSLVFMILVAVLPAWRASAFLDPPRPRLWPICVALAAASLAVWLWEPGLSESAWRQQNFLEQAPERLLNAGASTGTAGSLDDPNVQAVLGRDLRGERRVPIPENKPNILLVFVEGASGAYLPAVAEHQGVEERIRMPKLSARAEKEGIWASQFVNPQRQTNRGEYAALCGDHPKLSSKRPKMSEYVSRGDRQCLPSLLRKEGYHTAYLQAAELTFMMKNRFMVKAGFDEILGYSDFPEAYARSGWGVDDRALYEQVLERLVGYEELGKPWFAAVLNVGTHHPFPVPKAWKRQIDETKYSRAFAYADEALDQLMTGLEERGLLDHTLVIVISDESSGLWDRSHSELSKVISKNWGPMVSFGPGIEPKRLDGVFVQSDTALSVMDFIGLADRAPHLVGRSWFRDHEGPRDVAFANARHARQFWMRADGSLLMCKETEDSCEGHQLNPERLFSPEQSSREVDDGEVDLLRAAAAAAEANGAATATVGARSIGLVAGNAHVIDLSDEHRTSVIASGQYFELKESERLHVRLVYSLIGAGSEARVNMKIRRRIGHVLAQTTHDPLRPGDTVILDFTYSYGGPVKTLDVHLSAVLEKEGLRPRFVLEEATAVIEAAGPEEQTPKEGIELIEYSRITDQGERQKLRWFELTARSSRVRRNSCLSGSPELLEGIECEAGGIISSPKTWVHEGSKIGASATLEANGNQSIRAHFEVVTYWKGHQRVRKDSAFEVKRGSRRLVTMDRYISESSRKTHIRLVLDEPTESLRIADYQMWIRPDKKWLRETPRESQSTEP